MMTFLATITIIELVVLSFLFILFAVRRAIRATRVTTIMYRAAMVGQPITVTRRERLRQWVLMWCREFVSSYYTTVSINGVTVDWNGKPVEG